MADKKKALTSENALRLLRGRQKVLNCFESKIFSIEKQTQGKPRPGIFSLHSEGL